MMQFSKLSSIRRTLRSPLPWCLVLSLFLVTSVEAKPIGKGGGKPPPTTHIPMTLEKQTYYFRVPTENTCLGEDDELDWLASGSLAPGESFSFTPAYAGCNGHPAVISVAASWNNGTLDLTSFVPDIDFVSWDVDQLNKFIKAPVVNHRAQLCMFPAFTSDGVNYTITLTNNTTETVDGIELHGRHENDWSIFYYHRCLNADADGDGWNDSLEHSMASLLYPLGYIDDVFQPDILWGSNYLRPTARTPFTNDEIDSFPPDFNDDGSVSADDLDVLNLHVGEGNGIPLSKISPNPGPEWFHNNTLAWRRYDLDGDGYVGTEDYQITSEYLNMELPMSSDVVSPTARITFPQSGETVPGGQRLKIKSHAWDNSALLRVEYLVDGKTICTVTDPLPNLGFTSPLFQCWWDVPKRKRTYEIQVRVYDAAGNSGISQSMFVQGI